MKFTAEERRLLSRNPYTDQVSENRLVFTKEFKQEFWARYTAGAGPTRIVKDLGYDPKILGEKRIEGIAAALKKQYMRWGEFKNFDEAHAKTRGNRPEYPKMNDPASNAKTIKQMQNELWYLRQEVEFIKKILQTETERK